MSNQIQLNLFDQIPDHPKTSTRQPPQANSEWGTFKDSLRAPVHRWFTYPAGFSYKAVEHSIKRFNIVAGQTIYDPFMGSGTTNVVAKTHGINSIGVEAHPFVFKITQAKLDWDIPQADGLAFIRHVQECLPLKTKELKSFALEEEFPELILKCYAPKTIYDLWALREIVHNHDLSDSLRRFFFVVVTALLREVSTAATGWPYIAPKKKKITSVDKDVLTEFSSLAWQMIRDIDNIKAISNERYRASHHAIFRGDSRNTAGFIEDLSVDHVFTSPPYLNNFDYADRTRLELYFWGEAASWGDISTNIRAKLMTSATTQISRSDPKYEVSDELLAECPDVAAFINQAVAELGLRRKTKGGKKSYDLMVAGYFNDIHKIIQDVFRVLKPQTKALFVLGDSAPYGVHIPTDELIGQIGLDVGFTNYEIEVLRQRGGKWKDNPQRHSVKLRESIVILEKD